ncbi:MAG: hypothetical protein K0S72_1383, partial [Arthrobacter sp.]|nr:hypothetical protein [Arthrobacter sp.]
ANAKELAVVQVDVDGMTWNRQDRNGWQDSPAAGSTVTITLAAEAG